MTWVVLKRLHYRTRELCRDLGRGYQAQGKTSAKVMGSKKASDGLLSRGKDICAYETGGRQENGDNIVCDGSEKQHLNPGRLATV